MSDAQRERDGYLVRKASVADAPTLARQRRLMFDELEPLPTAEMDAVETAVRAYIERAMPAGTFHGWIVERDGQAVAGGGMQLRTLMPRPGYVLGEPEGLIVSMWTDADHRRRGVGRRVIEAILAWGAANGVSRFTLHASRYGRPLYELYGFTLTNEMRLEVSAEESD